MKYFGVDAFTRGPLTSLLGAVIIGVTLHSIDQGRMNWVWEGIAACSFAVVLIFIKDQILTLLLSALKALIAKFTKNTP